MMQASHSQIVTIRFLYIIRLDRSNFCLGLPSSAFILANLTAAKAYYFVVFGLTVVVSWVLRDYAVDALKNVPQIQTCFSAQANGDPGLCTGKGAVLRVSFGNFLFFAVHFVFLLGCRKQKDARKYLHTGCLTLQTLLWGGLIGVTFLMPNNVFYVWGQIARVLGAIFLVIQVILMLDFMFVINEFLVDRKACHFALILGSVILYLGGLAFNALAYYYYAPHASCGLNIFFITWTLVVAIFISALSVSPVRIRSAGLLTAGMVFGYAVWLLWAALSSEPQTYKCVAHQTGGQNQVIKIIGFVFALVAVVLATFFASTEASTFNLAGAKDDESLDYPPDWFHLIYMLASAYVAMLFISWNLQDVPGRLVVDKGWISVWFHMATQWLSFAVYIWTLVAPRILQGRDFEAA